MTARGKHRVGAHRRRRPRSHRPPYSTYHGWLLSTSAGLGVAHLLLANAWFQLGAYNLGLASIAMALAIPAIMAVSTT